MDAYYILRVKVDTYNNPQHEDFNGGCCEPSCSDCDNYFEFCLRRKGWSMTSVLCPLGFRSSEGASISDDTLTFGSQIASNLANPVEFTGNNWEVSETKLGLGARGIPYQLSEYYLGPCRLRATGL